MIIIMIIMNNKSGGGEDIMLFLLSHMGDVILFWGRVILITKHTRVFSHLGVFLKAEPPKMVVVL